MTDTQTPAEPTQTEAQHVLYVLDRGHHTALRPGDFTEKLIETAIVADNSNKALLAQGFPGIVEAVRTFQQDKRGLTRLHIIAEHGAAKEVRKTCTECNGKNSRDYGDNGQILSWCGFCDGNGYTWAVVPA